MISERRHLLTRCLRLEARIIALRGQHEIELPRGKRRVSAEDHDVLCDLRRQGIGISEIARRTRWSYSTVARRTRGV